MEQDLNIHLYIATHIIQFRVIHGKVRIFDLQSRISLWDSEDQLNLLGDEIQYLEEQLCTMRNTRELIQQRPRILAIGTPRAPIHAMILDIALTSNPQTQRKCNHAL
jgi:hypothetical protein